VRAVVAVEVEFDDLAETVVGQGNEHFVLDALAEENAAIAHLSSVDADEKAFALEAVDRLYKLAKWFRENQGATP
jgi:hypothetical protein